MSEQSEMTVPTTASSTGRPGASSADVRQLAYAWVGLWDIASEELGSFYQRCVARGAQIMNAKSSATLPQVKEPARDATAVDPKQAGPKSVRPTTILNAFGAVESYHIDLNVEELLPTKQAFDALSERVEALAREVDELAQQREV